MFRPCWISDVQTRDRGPKSPFQPDVRSSQYSSFARKVCISIFDWSRFLGAKLCFGARSRDLDDHTRWVWVSWRGRPRTHSHRRFALPPPQELTGFPGTGNNPPPLCHPLGSAASKIPENGPVSLEGASETESGLAKKEILHCKEKYTPTVGLFSF